MEIKLAKLEDVSIIHDVMKDAFKQYKDEVPPSSALDETFQSISASLQSGDQALISYLKGKPVGMVRFRIEDNQLYFYRLSVISEKQGQGIAKKIIQSLEEYAKSKGNTIMFCMVRLSVGKNIRLYHSMGYSIYKEAEVKNSNGKTLKVAYMQKQFNQH